MISIAVSFTTLLGLAASATIPNNDGFPNPNDQQKMQIAQEAGGLLPNAPLPTGVKASTVTAFQLIAANEIFETAYFNSLLQNITDGAPGYQAQNKNELIKIFTKIRSQEEQHALAAHAVLETNNAFAPSACQYMFPVASLKDGINVAETFTALVLGALQGANTLLAQDEKSIPLVQVISSVIGQEGEQNGYYRVFLQETPSESPFLTYVPAPFAWSALQMFIVPGSCPFDLGKIDLPILPGIMTNGGPIGALEPKDQTITLSTDLSKSDAGKKYINTDCKGLSLTYMTGQQLPISVDISNVKWCGSVLTFQAEFPYSKNVMQGLSHAALTMGNGFKSADAVVNATLAAPAVIQVMDSLTT